MEKKTFNDLMANLPTTETDMTKVMVEMEDGRKGWISANGLAQVMAGLMPVAGFNRKGLISNIFRKQDASNNFTWTKIMDITNSGTKNISMFGVAESYANQNSFILFITIKKYNEEEPKISAYSLLGKSSNNNYEVSIKYKVGDVIQVWIKGSFFFLKTGISTFEPIDENPPADALDLEIE